MDGLPDEKTKGDISQLCFQLRILALKIQGIGFLLGQEHQDWTPNIEIREGIGHLVSDLGEEAERLSTQIEENILAAGGD